MVWKKGESITQTVIEVTKVGDLAAARMILDRLAPPARQNESLFSVVFCRRQSRMHGSTENGCCFDGGGRVRFPELVLDGRELALQDLDNKVTASACRFQKAGINALRFVLHEFKHGLDQLRGRKYLSVVSDALSGFDQIHRQTYSKQSASQFRRMPFHAFRLELARN